MYRFRYDHVSRSCHCEEAVRLVESTKGGHCCHKPRWIWPAPDVGEREVVVVLIDVFETPALAVNHKKFIVTCGCFLGPLRVHVPHAISYPGADEVTIQAWSNIALSRRVSPFELPIDRSNRKFEFYSVIKNFLPLKDEHALLHADMVIAFEPTQ